MIPVGALVVKTYDTVEMAGGPFDNALSPESENAVQNKVIETEVKKLDKAISDAVALRASLTGFGMGKICPTDLVDATEDNGLVLGAKEKNASVSGSLANQIETLDSLVLKKLANPPGNDANLAVTSGIYVTNGDTTNIPQTWSILVVFESSGYVLQILQNVDQNTHHLYVRHRSNNLTWGGWTKYEGTEVS